MIGCSERIEYRGKGVMDGKGKEKGGGRGEEDEEKWKRRGMGKETMIGWRQKTEYREKGVMDGEKEKGEWDERGERWVWISGKRRKGVDRGWRGWTWWDERVEYNVERTINEKVEKTNGKKW